jgi:hypothetical protein
MQVSQKISKVKIISYFIIVLSAIYLLSLPMFLFFSDVMNVKVEKINILHHCGPRKTEKQVTIIEKSIL